MFIVEEVRWLSVLRCSRGVVFNST
jgi:hypothetical protein